MLSIFYVNIVISAISALYKAADNRYADIEKNCRYADIADDDINIVASLMTTQAYSTDDANLMRLFLHSI